MEAGGSDLTGKAEPFRTSSGKAALGLVSRVSRQKLASFCRETRKDALDTGFSPGGTTACSPGCSGAATAAQRNPGGPEELTQAPEGRRKTALDQGTQPKFCRPSRAGLVCCWLTQGFAALHPGLQSAAPSGAEIDVWRAFPSFPTETS